MSGKDIPNYEWNIIDAKSRFRFIGYSYNKTADIGLRFLLTVIQHLRSQLVCFDREIQVGVDNGADFCSGSRRKETDLNELLSEVNASLYSYEPGHDIRKNLIERSHRSDDEELYIPRGRHMRTKDMFMKEATTYSYYWNSLRRHSGHGMRNRTPVNVLEESGLVGAQQLLSFPTLILDEYIRDMALCNRPIELSAYARNNPHIIEKAFTCQKTYIDIVHRFDLHKSAQNVLTYYRLPPFSVG